MGLGRGCGVRETGVRETVGLRRDGGVRERLWG